MPIQNEPCGSWSESRGKEGPGEENAECGVRNFTAGSILDLRLRARPRFDQFRIPHSGELAHRRFAWHLRPARATRVVSDRTAAATSQRPSWRRWKATTADTRRRDAIRASGLR